LKPISALSTETCFCHGKNHQAAKTANPEYTHNKVNQLLAMPADLPFIKNYLSTLNV